MMKKTAAFFSAILLGMAVVPAHAVEAPVATDSRIRTFVYGENEVFHVITRYGYQSNIEFAPTEEITTLSVGDSVAFKVTPAGNRVFIRAMEENKETNMTVVTNLHAYQFEVSSIVEKEEDLVYVMRFYYPDKDFDRRPVQPASAEFSKQVVDESYNFNYSLTGPEALAPVRVFDNGQYTFFKFPRDNESVPQINMVNQDGSESPLVSRDDGEYIVVERVFSQYSLRKDDQIVCVFNDEKIPSSVREQ